MAETEKKFSELTAAAVLTDADILAISQIDSATASLMSKRTTLIAIANKLASLTNYTSELTTQDKTLTGAINELKQLISLIPQFSIDVVQTLPVSDISETTIYLVPSSDPEQGNYYEEYIYVNNTWELVGTTAVDLSAYYTKLEVDELLAAKANTSDVTAALALKEAKADMDDDVTDIIVALTDTQTTTPGNPVTLTTEQSGGAKSAVVTFTPKQSGTGDPSPTNIRPFVLWDSLNLNKCDENYAQLWTIDSNFGGTVDFNQQINNGNFATNSDWSAYNNTKTTVSIANGIMTITALSEGGGYQYGAKQNLTNNPVVGHKYIITAKINPDIAGTYGFDFAGNTVGKIKMLSAGVWNDYAVVISTNNNPNICIIEPTVTQTTNATIQIKNVMIIDLTQMFGSTIADYIYSLEQATAGSGVAFFRSMYPNDYYPYNTGTSEMVGTNIATATFDEPVAGGSYDFVSGEGQSNMGMVDMGTLNWVYNTNYAHPFFTRSFPNYNFTNQGEAMASQYKKISNRAANTFGNTAEDGQFCFGTINSQIYIRDDRYTDAETFKTAMSGVQLCYELATPTEITLTPEDIELLKGSNTVWSDANGTVTVGYSKLPNGNLGAVVDYIKKLEARVKALET